MNVHDDAAQEKVLQQRPTLLALDWGTSSLRAFLLDGEGRVLRERANGCGLQNLPQPGVAGFEQAFAELCGNWLARWPGLPVVAGGMVGSKQGWKEAPYVLCPADTTTLAGQAVTVDSAAGTRILLAPGILYDPPGAAPDVIRGEEIQIAGVLADHPEWRRRACIALPGTHSKWVRIADGRITGFATYMTGEMFAVLRKHSILGRLMPEGAAADTDTSRDAFAAGIAAAKASRPGDLPHQLFATRTLGLTGRLPADTLADYLSGLLIGHELVSGLEAMADGLGPDTPLLLIGEGSLCRRYEEALGILGVPLTARLANTAPRGLFQFARAAGLIAPEIPT